MTDDHSAHLHRRRSDAATAWNLDDEVVLVAAGDLISIPGGADQVFPFHPHSEYRWLADRERPGSVLAFDAKTGEWVDFVPRVTEEERVWVGDVPDEGVPLEGLSSWLSDRSGRSVVVLGCELPRLAERGATADRARTERLREALTHARRPKDEVEVERMRRAAAATAAGFARAGEAIAPGVTERSIQIEMEAEFFRHGAQRPAYDSIVGSGPNAAVFHFAPSQRECRPGEVVLIDAGAEVDGYASDVTRVFPVGDSLPADMQDLYDVVLAAEKKGVEMCRDGQEYTEIHFQAALDMTQGLVDLGYLRGDPQSLVEQDVTALFFPHGVGHLVGLGVRDASGYLPGRQRSTRPGLKNLRLNLPLRAGYTVTIEPGLYFVPALLEKPENRDRFRSEVVWEKVDPMIGRGGIRIEDNVLVTDGDPVNLTEAIPK